jgi:protoporphyrinogen oxidase
MEMAELHPVVILGGGLTGTSVAFHLGDGYRLVEREDRLGGLARTERVGGFLFDLTGHYFHARDPYTKALLRRILPGGLIRVARRSMVYSHGVYTRYPFQANTHGLPPPVVKECLLGFLEAGARSTGGAAEPENFEEWILHHFGRGIARYFMIPYNEKMWGVPPREITSRWCDRFVPKPRLDEVVAGAVGCHDRELGYNASFHYPREGGIETLSRALARRVRGATCGLEARRVFWRDRFVVLSDGSEVGYGHLVSTLPLPELIRRLRPPPPEPLRREARKLRHTSVFYLNYGVRGEPPHAHHWMYVPEKKFPFYRIGFPSNVHRPLAPEGHYSMSVEISHRAPLAFARARERVREGLKRAGLLARERDIALELERDIPYAYVVFDRNYFEARDSCLGWLTEQSATSAGRYGRWIYSSMEDAILEGRAVAEQLRAGARAAGGRP